MNITIRIFSNNLGSLVQLKRVIGFLMAYLLSKKVECNGLLYNYEEFKGVTALYIDIKHFTTIFVQLEVN